MHPIPSRRALGEELALVIATRISSGEWSPGMRIPAEHALASQFGVSRAVVREAMVRLRADGITESRQGAGAFVAIAPGGVNFRLEREVGSSPGDPADRSIFELRGVLEEGIAGLAARRRNDAGVRTLEAALVAMDQALKDRSGGAAADDAFHFALVVASGNHHLKRLMEVVGRAASASRRPTWSVSGHAAGLAAEAQAEHRLIFEAVRAGNEAGARQAAARHIEQAARRLGLAQE